MLIKFVLDGGKHDGEFGECDDVGTIYIEGNSYHRVNILRGGHWVFVPSGGPIPPGTMWQDDPYRPPVPQDQCPDLVYGSDGVGKKRHKETLFNRLRRRAARMIGPK